MPMDTDPLKVVARAKERARDIANEMSAVHGPIWAGRDDITKLTLTLSSATLVGTISFAGAILGQKPSGSFAGYYLVVSWVLFLVSICLGLLSLWHGNILKSFRARFTNAMPSLKKEAAMVQTNTTEALIESILTLVKKYSDMALNPIGEADRKAERCAKFTLVSFILALVAFIICGITVVT